MAHDPERSASARAAQYLRMSTDLQLHSIDVQAAVIADYAEKNGITIVRTYLDAGRSGLTLRGRPGLKSLLEDAAAGRADYDQVLVYDVSRWGRFQEVDEAAKYEQVCRDAGLAIVFCAEPFEGGGRAVTAIMKAVRRVMAAEYSRDLSDKVTLSHQRVARLGHWTGGPAPFGYERWTVGAAGSEPRRLMPGQRKGLSDHTTLRPGPPEAVRTVRRLFRLFAVHGRHRMGVAATLNAEGSLGPGGRPWSHSLVGRVLASEVYLGTMVTQKKRHRLGGRAVLLPPDQWVRCPKAFEPIIDAATFRAVQAILAERRPNARSWSDEQMIEGLVRHKANGASLTTRGVEMDRSLPWPAAYLRRFGSMGRAFELAGATAGPGQQAADARTAMRRRRAELRGELALTLHSRGHAVSISRGVLTIDGWLDVTFAANGPRQHHSGTVWEFRRPTRTSRLLVAARLSSHEGPILDAIVFDARVMKSSTFRLGPHSAYWRAADKVADMEQVADILQARLHA